MFIVIISILNKEKDTPLYSIDHILIMNQNNKINPKLYFMVLTLEKYINPKKLPMAKGMFLEDKILAADICRTKTKMIK
jgi:hypothetical protein